MSHKCFYCLHMEALICRESLYSSFILMHVHICNYLIPQYIITAMCFIGGYLQCAQKNTTHLKKQIYMSII